MSGSSNIVVQTVGTVGARAALAELVQAWARDVATGTPIHILELGPERRGAKSGCECPSCNLPLTAVNAAKSEFVRRPHFRHPEGAERAECLVIAARAAAVRQLQDEGWLELPRRQMSARATGLSGAIHEAWIERPPERVRIPGITELVLEPGSGASIQVPKFTLGVERFSAIKRSIDSITARSRERSLRERRLLTFNELLHAANPTKFERRYPKVKPGEIYELVKLGGRAQSRSANDRLAAAAVVRDEAAKIAAEQPAKLVELKAVIEQVTLKELIDKIEALLCKNLPEPKWQAFFKANPFVLSLAFPHPVILIQEQAHVGGTMLSGAGESIVDFLFAQRFTGSLALIEIKRPSTKLIEAKTFRGDLHAPHKDLTSAIAQVLDQRYQLLGNFAAKSHDPALKDTHVSAVHCIVIAGMAPASIQEKRSLDLFRYSSKDVVVVTFDELLDKLRQLFRLMGAEASEPGTEPALEPPDNSDLV